MIVRSSLPSCWRLLAWVLVVLASASIASAQYDVLIRGARLLDGTGSPWRYADVGIQGDRITVVGAIPTDATARRVIDARGKYIAPGFIDPHSHAWPGIGTAALADAKPILYQGITTVLINPDGGGPADLAPQLDAIRRVTPGVNVAPMIGHNGIRSTVMGNDQRAPTPAELQEMKNDVRRAMQLGAFGFSSGPFYIPGKFSKTDELIALAQVAAEFPDAYYTSHIRDESNYDVGVVAAADEVIAVARAAHLPGVITHIKCIGPAVWGKSQEIIAHVEAARAEGLEIWADQYPYAASSTSLQAALLPGWVQDGGAGPQAARLASPEQRDRIRREMGENLERRAGAQNIQIARYAADHSLEGKRLDDIARSRTEEPVDTAIAILLKGGASIISNNMNDADLIAFMRQPWTMTCTDGNLVAFGSGSEHPRAYGAFPRKIHRYVYELGVITLEAAVHSSTGLPASVFRVKQRGTLEPGAFADVLIFDPKKVADLATYEKPHAYSTGFDYILLNGELAVADGKVTESRHGRVLLRDTTAARAPATGGTAPR